MGQKRKVRLRYRYRSAITGRFISKAQAERMNPDNWIREVIKYRKRKYGKKL